MCDNFLLMVGCAVSGLRETASCGTRANKRSSRWRCDRGHWATGGSNGGHDAVSWRWHVHCCGAVHRQRRCSTQPSSHDQPQAPHCQGLLGLRLQPLLPRRPVHDQARCQLPMGACSEQSLRPQGCPQGSSSCGEVGGIQGLAEAFMRQSLLHYICWGSILSTTSTSCSLTVLFSFLFLILTVFCVNLEFHSVTACSHRCVHTCSSWYPAECLWIAWASQ